jgi:RNA polymerase sigma-B factor
MGERDARFDSVEERALLAPAWPRLPAREQSILRMRFVQGLTQSEIAVTIGVSQMHVSRLLAASLDELRQHIGNDDRPRIERSPRDDSLRPIGHARP